MLDGSADLHFYFFVHLFSELVLVAHNNKKAHSEKTGQNEDEKDDAYYDLVWSGSIILDTSLTFFKTEFSTNGGLKGSLAVNLELE